MGKTHKYFAHVLHTKWRGWYKSQQEPALKHIDGSAMTSHTSALFSLADLGGSLQTAN